MKKKLIIISIVLIVLFSISFAGLKIQGNKNSENVEDNTKKSLDIDSKEITQEVDQDETKDNNSNEEEKIEEQEAPKEKQNTNEEKKTNSNSNKNTQSSNHEKKEKTTTTTQDNKQSVESKKVWEELGISEYDYYHKPMWRWARIDYSVDTYGTEEATHQACIDAGSKLENITSFTCYNINSYSGDYLGDMLEIKEG